VPEGPARIAIAILALGGQGGGVLADWLTAVGEAAGYYVQATSVPGVAQRTGSTIYYLELVPEERLRDRQPILALMPAPGDVDLVVALELMEAGRAILRGLVARDRTTLVASTHRIYAISEKSAVANGIADGAKVLAAARAHAKDLIAFDMDELAARNASAVSAVMLGAIAASRALPFSRQRFEDAIRASGVAVDANLAGFAAGYEGRPAAAVATPSLTTEEIVEEGVRRLTDYLDEDYAGLYRSRLQPFTDPAVKREVARALALWMSYEDVMRVAQIKTRASRTAKVLADIGAGHGQIVHLTEYMHPRWEELCDTLPARLGARLARGGLPRRLLAPLFDKGRHVRTTSVSWFLALRILAALRRGRRKTYRFARENAGIEAWLAAVAGAAQCDTAAAIELARCPELIKGYGDTNARGRSKFDAIMQAWQRAGTQRGAELLGRLRRAALEDEDGTALQRELRSSA
jgi:indolepyruvate ferredoxin oxidoreductase beta subunit